MTPPIEGQFVFDRLEDGVRLRVRLTPRARRSGLDGAVQLADGRWAAQLRVAAPPVEGAANEALIAVLADSLRLPKSRLTIVAGQSSRLKAVAIAGDPGDLAARLTAWIAAAG